MENKDILNVHVDTQRGEYILSRNNGQETVVRTIKNEEQTDYDALSKKAKIKEIGKKIKLNYIPSEKEDEIDLALYDALEEFDTLYGTHYSNDYAKIIIEQITYAGLSEKEKDRKKRAISIKKGMFEEAGLNIMYDLNLFKVAKNLTIADRVKLLSLARAQKSNGIQVNINKKISTETQVIEDRASEETVSEKRDENIVNESVTEEIISTPKLEEPIVETIIPEPKVEEPVIEKVEVVSNTEEKPKTETKPSYEPRPKKEMSRSKSRQASKKAAREAGKMKNIYKNKVETKKQPILSEEEKRKLAQQRREAKLKKAAEAARIAREQAAEAKRLKAEQEKEEQERIAREEQAKKDAKLTSRIKRIVLGKKTSDAQEEHIVKRFTRKLKDKTDSIRNKIHIPNISGRRKIAGAVGAVCIVVALGFGLANLNSNGNSSLEDNRPTIESTYDVETESQKPDELQAMPEQKDYTEGTQNATRTEEDNQVQTESSIDQENIETIVDTETKEETETPKTEDSSVEKEETDSSIEYLNSVRVGARMNIESGKYFESPDGTGNYGYFENNQDGAKEITIIGVSTYEGYIAITDPNVSLYELKQQYPDAKFSYHFVCKYEDGTTKTLGWLTENSREQNIDNTRTQSAGEER